MRRSGYTSGIAVVLFVGLTMGCGVVGPPIPPEQVGVAATIARQKQVHDSQSREQKSKGEAPVTAEEPALPPVGQDEELPPLRPVGGR